MVHNHPIIRGNNLIQNNQIHRLHLILKPFMLRRIKRDIEREMPSKTELLISAPLSNRQKLFYTQLQAKIRNKAALLNSITSNNNYNKGTGNNKDMNGKRNWCIYQLFTLIACTIFF